MKRWFVALIAVALGTQASAIDLKQLKPLEQLRLEDVGQYPTGVQFSPDDQYLLSVNMGYQVSLWRVADGSRIWVWELPDPTDKHLISSAEFVAANQIRLRLMNQEQVTLRFGAGAPSAETKVGELTRLETAVQGLNLERNQRVVADANADTLAYTLFQAQIAGSQDAQARSANPGLDIILVDIASHQELARLHEWHGEIAKLRFSPDGKTLAAWRQDGRISLWDVATHQKRFNLRGFEDFYTSQEYNLVWSDDSARLLTLNWSTQILWDAQTGTEISRPAASSETVWRNFAVYSATISHSGKTLALASAWGVIELVDAQSGSSLRRIGFPVQTVLFSSDAVWLYALSRDGRLRSFERTAQGYRQRDEQNLKAQLGNAALLEAQHLMVVSLMTPENMAVYDLDSHELKKYKIAVSPGFEALTPTPNSSRVVIGVHAIFDARDGSLSALPIAYAGQPSPDLKWAICMLEKNLVTFDLGTGTPLWQRVWPLSPRVMRWSSSGSLLAVPWLEGKIQILETRGGKTLFLLDTRTQIKPNSDMQVLQLTFSPGENLLVAKMDDDSLQYFDLKTRKALPAPPALSSALEAQFTPDGQALVLTTLRGLEFWGLPGQQVFGR